MFLEAPKQITRPPSSFLSIAQRKLDQFATQPDAPERRIDRAKQCLDIIDIQYVQNLFTYKVPGTNTLFPITRVSVADVIQALSNTPHSVERDAKQPSHRKIAVIFPGFYHSPNLHPLGHGDMIYDKVTSLMPEVARSIKAGTPIDAFVYIWGYPTGVWGKVDPEWTKMLRQNGLSQYGKDLAGFIRSLGINEQTQFLFHGMSAGSVIAALTAQELADELPTTATNDHPARLQLLLDNPAGAHNKGFLPGMQVPLGFVAEAIFRVATDPTTREAAFAIGANLETAIPYFDKRGIPSYYKDREQTKLKQEAIIAGFIGLLKGSPFDTEQMHMFIRRGIVDPVSLSATNIVHVLKQVVAHKRGTQPPFQQGDDVLFPLGTSHAIDYLRAKRLVGRVDNTMTLLSQT